MNVFDFLEEQQNAQVEFREWMKECEFVLVTADNIKECIDRCIAAPDGFYGLDLETTGLDNRVFDGRTVDSIVGVCLSPDGITGYYIPLAHKEGAEHNIPWTVFEEEFRRLMDATTAGKVVAVFHGGMFDQEFLEFWGGEPFGDWDKAGTWDDTAILVYLDDSRRKNKQLKSLAKEELGWDQIELIELWPEGYEGPKDFSLLDPSRKEVVWYGGGDGIVTYRLRTLFYDKVIKSQRSIYQIEKACAASIRWMQRNRIYIDQDKVLELIQLGQQEWMDSVEDLYNAVSEQLGRDVMPGYYKSLKAKFEAANPYNLLNEQIARAKAVAPRENPDPRMPIEKGDKTWPPIYDVSSPQQLGQMFFELRVPGLKFTEKSGQVKTSKDVLDEIIDRAEARFPYMVKVKRFREVQKAMSNFLFPMLEHCDPKDGTARINFRAHKVDTGRFATPAKQRVQLPGWPQMNLQSMPAGYDPNRPECMRRLRECVAARPGSPSWPKGPKEPEQERFVIAIDFSGVELRIVTNLSREPKWLTEFFRCSSCSMTFDRGDGTATPIPPPPRCPKCGSDKIGDLHTLTALSVYGNDAVNKPEWKQLRKQSKGANFALLYGGSGNAVVRSTNCSKQEGWRIKRVFDQTYKTLGGWQKAQHAFARKHGYVLTGFGRKYPLPDINHEDGFFRSKAERNAVNGPIQGCLHPNGKIKTPEGIFTLQELWDTRRDEIFTVWSGNGWVDARIMHSGKKALRKTRLDDGRDILTSPDHLFRVWENGDLTWKSQDKLEKDDWVVVDNSEVELHRLLPSDIVSRVGREVYCSNVYSTLPQTQKSAVLRLKSGSGSYLLCQKSWQLLPTEHRDQKLDNDLARGYRRVAASEDLHEHVDMFDLEVFSEDHAFTCDGVVVHNSSADITKIAMALVYKECKKRGWHEDAVLMIITMHDELVFDIRADVLAEAISVISEIMGRNPLILGKKWPVPLTSDVEIGYSWAAPWDLNTMRAGEVRYHGNTKLKSPDAAVQLGLSWEALPSFPPELAPHFGVVVEETPIVNAPPLEQKDEEESTPPQGLKKGDEYVFSVPGPLRTDTAHILAETIRQTRGRGTRILKMKLPNGMILNDLAPWRERYGEEPVYVNENEFFYTAKALGLKC